MPCRDLGQKEYRGIEATYRGQLLELTTTEMATRDLEKYHKVLDCPCPLPVLSSGRETCQQHSVAML